MKIHGHRVARARRTALDIPLLMVLAATVVVVTVGVGSRAFATYPGDTTTTEPATTAPPATEPPVTEPATTTTPTTEPPPPPPTTVTPSTAPVTVSVAPPPTLPPCTPDPYGRALDESCEVDPCVPADGSTASPNYVPGHVPGGKIGTTAGHIFDCTIPTPAGSLPVTGSDDAGTIALYALAVIAAGALLVAVSRRRQA